jgi:hypothetical protein
MFAICTVVTRPSNLDRHYLKIKGLRVHRTIIVEFGLKVRKFVKIFRFLPLFYNFKKIEVIELYLASALASLKLAHSLGHSNFEVVRRVVSI